MPIDDNDNDQGPGREPEPEPEPEPEVSLQTHPADPDEKTSNCAHGLEDMQVSPGTLCKTIEGNYTCHAVGSDAESLDEECADDSPGTVNTLNAQSADAAPSEPMDEVIEITTEQNAIDYDRETRKCVDREARKRRASRTNGKESPPPSTHKGLTPGGIGIFAPDGPIYSPHLHKEEEIGA